MKKYIYCPICGKAYMRLTIHHLKEHNYNNREEFLKDYPNTKFNSEFDSSRRSECARDSFTDEMRELARINGRNNLIKFNKTQWQGDKGKERRQKRSEYMKSIANNPDIQKKAALSRIGTKSKTRSKSMIERWKDDDYAQRVITNTHKSLAGLKEYSEGYFRSSWENKLAENLKLLNVKYEYETLTFKYSYNGKTKRYIPDFYLPEYNIIIEVKDDRHINDELTKVKSECIPDKYRYYILGRDKIFKTFNSFWKNILEGATTIETITNKKYVSE